MAMKKILLLCEKHGLMKPQWSGSGVSSLKFGPLGEFLVNNVRQEWILYNVINRDENVYPIHSSASKPDEINRDILETYIHVRSLCNSSLPFGVAQTMSSALTVPESVQEASPSQPVFNPSNRTNLRSLLFVSSEEGRKIFYSWQQKRKIWWRKFSTDPARFSLSDITEFSENPGEMTSNLRINILADFEWGPTVIETINLSSLASLGVTSEENEDLKIKVGRKHEAPSVVECKMSLDIATLVFLCDAYVESSRKKMFRLHRRLAPIKAGFVVNTTDSSSTARLLDVAKHLSRTMRQNGLTTLLLPDTTKKAQDSQLTQHDEMGIPFTVIVSDSTLSNGIIHLYSRETTLQEQVHISKLPDYMNLLVKNY